MPDPSAAPIEPFTIDIAQADLDDLTERLRRTRWAEPETVDDWSQGIPSAYLREVCDYWADGYDWRATEQRLNRVPPVPHRDRRARHPLPARALAPPRRAAADHHPRVAGLDRRVPQGDRAADRPDRLGGDAADAFHVVCPAAN